MKIRNKIVIFCFLIVSFEEFFSFLLLVGEEQSSEVFGTSPESAIKTTFHFNEPDEKINIIKVRSGAYIDGIEIETNKKCSGWTGGDGGDLTVHKIDNDRFIKACVGTAGKYVGSLGFVLNRYAFHDKKYNASHSSAFILSRACECVRVQACVYMHTRICVGVLQVFLQI